MNDSKTSIKELKDLVQKFCEERDWNQFHTAKELSIGIITESSELLEYFRFKNETESEALFNSPGKKQKISEEVADVLYFLLRLSQKYDIDLSNELEKKIEGNEKRYPIEKSKGSNKKYTEL